MVKCDKIVSNSKLLKLKLITFLIFAILFLFIVSEVKILVKNSAGGYDEIFNDGLVLKYSIVKEW